MHTIETLFSSIWIALVQTYHQDFWVFILLAYCIFVGVKASKGGVVPYVKILIVPVVFTYLSITTLMSSFTIDLFVLSAYALGLFSGSAGGWLQAHKQEVKADRAKMLLQLKGTWSTLVIILIIFSTKFYFGYSSAIDPALLKNTHYELAMLLISGITTGLFVGRALYYTRCLFFGESVELIEKQ